MDLGRVLHVVAEGLILPSQTIADVNLAEIGLLEFDVALSELLKGRLELLDLHVDGAEVALVVDQYGTSSWSTAKVKSPRGSAADISESEPAGNTPPPRLRDKNGNLVDFLAGHRMLFSNSELTYRDARNGLEFDLVLTSLDVTQKDQFAPVTLQGVGRLNGQDLSLNGTFPQEQPFKVSLNFSQISIEVDGSPDPGGYDVGYAAAIAVEIGELGQLLDVLKLEKMVSGTGHVRAVFKRSGKSARIESLDMLITLDGGQSLQLTGALGELSNPSDVTLDTSIRLYSEANRPPPTKARRDLKLIGVDMQIIAQPDGIAHRRMVIETNGFVLDTRGEGPPPISFSEISRTPEGHLRIGKLVLRIGPPEANFVVLEGSVEDVLQLEGIDIEGRLSMPMASLVTSALSQSSDALGHLTGGFRLSGNAHELSLSDLRAASQGTDLWSLKVSGAIENLLQFRDIALDIAVDVPSGAKLLSALKLDPIKTGPLAVTYQLSTLGSEWATEVTIAVAASQLGFNMKLDIDDPSQKIRGQIVSDLIRVRHLRDIIAAAMQLAKLNDLARAASQGNAPASPPHQSEDVIGPEPLVLKSPEQTDPADTEGTDGDAIAGASTSQPTGPFRNVTLQPLGQSILLSGIDLGVAIDLRKIEGVKGASHLTSDLEIKDQKARLGPLKFEYGGGHFNVSGAMNLKDAPDTLQLSGSMGGWNFGNIMQDLGFKKRASGTLYATFDVSGSHASTRDFLATLRGRATVSMKNGNIDSQLLDLAGLGVVPWLFSKEREAVVTIVCVRAPITISKGRLTTKQAVVETDRVQLVVLGNVDLKHQTLDIVGQPRRIGKPLSRSPWPFTAAGPIANPKIKVQDGPRRLRRSDGASTMPQKRKNCVPDILQLR